MIYLRTLAGTGPVGRTADYLEGVHTVNGTSNVHTTLQTAMKRMAGWHVAPTFAGVVVRITPRGFRLEAPPIG